MKVSRPRLLAFYLKDEPTLDVLALLRGEVKEGTPRVRILGVGGAPDSEVEVAPTEWQVLLHVPSDGSISISELEKVGVDKDEIQRLIDKGLLEICSNKVGAEGRTPWDLFSRLHHIRCRNQETLAASLSDFDYEKKLETRKEDSDNLRLKFGEPPTRSFRYALSENGKTEIDLPRARQGGEFFDLLTKRVTHRFFDRDQSFSLDHFSTLLKYVFGEWGVYKLTPEFQLSHKTSPSGGSLHPIEAFPLVIDIDGLQPGIYHYQGDTHRLAPLTVMPKEQLRKLAVDFGQGQKHVGDAHALVILAARFERSFWKYRNRANNYNVIMTDAGCLAQSFYLVCSKLGLGAFYTGAMDPHLVNSTLEFDDESIGAVGICGCGIPISNDVPLLYRHFREE